MFLTGVRSKSRLKVFGREIGNPIAAHLLCLLRLEPGVLPETSVERRVLPKPWLKVSERQIEDPIAPHPL